jgi:hypothetical protein
MLLSLLSLFYAASAGAQADSFPASVAGFNRVSLDGEAGLQPGPVRWLSIAGSYMPFIGDHLQLGLAPAFLGVTGSGASDYQASVAGTANVVVGRSRWRGYAGAFAGGIGGTRRIGETLYGVQAGALYFLSPTAALRAEARSRNSTYPGSSASAETFLTIDSYLSDVAKLGEPSPSLGAIDVYGIAYLSFVDDHELALQAIVAPFLTPWAQVGTEYQRVSFRIAGTRDGASLVNGFVRLYAPHGWGVVPFVHAFAESSSFVDVNSGGGLTSVGAMAGVRHYFNPGAALDVGVQERRQADQQSQSPQYRLPNEITLKVRMVTQLQLR